MKYFNSLPLVSIRNEDGTSKLYRNLLTRLSVIPSVLKNPLVYYSYDIQEGDTPEIVAHKYYGDSYRYWIVLFSNNILDPQWNWPLSSSVLDEYIIKKYENMDIDVFSDVKSYRKTITKYNITNNTTTVDVIDISEDEYDDLVPSQKTVQLPEETLQITIDKSTQSYYEYEVELNESKRNIRLLNKNYVSQLETEFKKLIG